MLLWNLIKLTAVYKLKGNKVWQVRCIHCRDCIVGELRRSAGVLVGFKTRAVYCSLDNPLFLAA